MIKSIHPTIFYKIKLYFWFYIDVCHLKVYILLSLYLFLLVVAKFAIPMLASNDLLKHEAFTGKRCMQFYLIDADRKQ